MDGLLLNENKFVGRGEVLAKKIIMKLIDCVGIQQQVNIKNIVSKEEYDFFDEEIQNHNHDLVLRRVHGKDIVIEVNYKHKEKAARKYRQIFIPAIKDAGYLYLEINDWDCDPHGLFYLNSNNVHVDSWLDYADVINALMTCKIKPNKLIK